MDLQDKILAAVIDTQADIKDIQQRIERLEFVQTRTYDKLDGFMIFVSRHEAEISALHSRLQRLEDRLKQIETVQ